MFAFLSCLSPGLAPVSAIMYTACNKLQSTLLFAEWYWHNCKAWQISDTWTTWTQTWTLMQGIPDECDEADINRLFSGEQYCKS